MFLDQAELPLYFNIITKHLNVFSPFWWDFKNSVSVDVWLLTPQPFAHCRYHFSIIVLPATSQVMWLVVFIKSFPELVLLSLPSLIRRSDVCSDICSVCTVFWHAAPSLHQQPTEISWRWISVSEISFAHKSKFYYVLVLGTKCQRFWNSLSNYPIDNIWSLATSFAYYLLLKCHLLTESKILD